LPRIVEEKHYDGALEKIERLGLGGLLDEIRRIITRFQLLVKEETDANGGAAVRKMLDAQFEHATGWEKKQTGGVDWIKCQVVNGARVCIGVEVQFSARSDLLVIDIIHLRKAITQGRIDVGVLVVPSDRLGNFLTDRGPSMSDAKRHVLEARAEDLPLILIALEHDGPGPPLAKQEKKPRKVPEPQKRSKPGTV
jgi:hypothetical protein